MSLRIFCPGCTQTLSTTDEQVGKVAGCPHCDTRFRVPAKVETVITSATKMQRDRRSVVYIHHTRDQDGDVVFFFRDVEGRHDAEPLRSSPIVAIRRERSPTIDLAGNGALCRFVVATQNSQYDVQMPRDKADHIAKELGGFLAEMTR